MQAPILGMTGGPAEGLSPPFRQLLGLARESARDVAEYVGDLVAQDDEDDDDYDGDKDQDEGVFDHALPLLAVPLTDAVQPSPDNGE
jgi:hypothetical protein